MTRINKSKDGIIGPKPDVSMKAVAKVGAKITKLFSEAEKSKKKSKKKFTKVMKARKTKRQR